MTVEKFLNLSCDFRIAVIPYCSTELRREIASMANETPEEEKVDTSAETSESPSKNTECKSPARKMAKSAEENNTTCETTPKSQTKISLANFNKYPDKVALRRGPMGISPVAAVDLAENEEIYTLRGPILPYATVFTIQVTKELHMNPYGGSEFLAHSCRPNTKVVIEKLKGEPECEIPEQKKEESSAQEGGEKNENGTPRNETKDFMVAHPYVLRVITIAAIPAGEVLSFNYLTTEYAMDEPFECVCAAQDMTTGAVIGSVPPDMTPPRKRKGSQTRAGSLSPSISPARLFCFGKISGFKDLNSMEREELAPYCTEVVKQCAVENGLLKS